MGVEKCNNLNNSLEGLNNRCELGERRIYKLEVRSIEIIQSEYEKEKWKKINEQSAQELWDTIKCTSICMMEYWKEWREREKILKELMTENLPYLMKNPNLYISEL